jgi:hypothetical protein
MLVSYSSLGDDEFFAGRRLSGLAGDNNPKDHVGQQPGQAAWHEQDQEKQAKPPGVDGEKDTQPAAHPPDDTVLSP